MPSSRPAWLTLLLLWCVAFAMAVELAPGECRLLADDSPFASFLLDGVRQAMAAKSMRIADRYFHRGVDHGVAEAFTNTPFQRLRDRISPREIVHREGDAIAEILPWLWFGTRLDGANLDNVLTTAYWLHVAGRPLQAARLLAEAQRRIGPRPELYLARARAALALGRTAEATAMLAAGLKCLGKEADTERTRLTRRQLLTYRACLHELAGETHAAALIYRQLAQTDPARCAGLAKRADALENGLPVSPSAAECLRAVLHVTAACAAHHHDTPPAGQRRHDAATAGH